MATRSTITPGDGDPRHGTTNGYCNLSCRCEACRAAWTEHRRGWVARQEPLAPDDKRHGTESGYRNYRCRCGACKEAARTRTGASPRTPPQCGTTSAYRKGCRCDQCRAANAASMRAYRKAMKS